MAADTGETKATRPRIGPGLVISLVSLVAATIAVIVVVMSAGDSDPDSADGTTATTTDGTAPMPPTVTVADEPEGLPERWTEVGEPGVGGRVTSLAFDPFSPDNLLAGGDLLGIARSTDGGASWEATTGLENPEIGEITFDLDTPGRVWAGTMGGPHVSDDGGSTWALAREGMPPTDDNGYTAPIEVVLPDPTDSSRLIALGGSQRRWVAPGEPAFGAVWESTDDGQTWQRLGTVADNGNIQAGAFFAGSGDNLITAVADRGAFTSSDGGATWSSASDGLPHRNVTDVTTHPTDPDRAWITLDVGPQEGDTYVPGGVYRTDDGGETWELSGTGLTQFEWEDTLLTSSYEAIVVSPSDPDRLYTADFSFRENFIYRSDDGGSSWTAVIGDDLPVVGAYSSGVTARELAVDPTDADRFMFAQDEYIMLSGDAGATARDITADVTADETYIGRGFSGLVATEVAFNPFREGDVTLLAFDGGNHLQTIDGFSTFRRSLRGEFDYGGSRRAAFTDDGDTIYLLLGQDNRFRGVGRSFDGGATFEIAIGAEAGLPDRDSDTDETGLAVDPTDGSVLYIVLDGRLLQSTDSGATFDPISNREDAYDVAFDPTSGEMILTTNEGLFVSTDGGATLTPVADSPTDLRRISFDPTAPGRIIVVSGDIETAVHVVDRSGLEPVWNEILRIDHLRQVAAHPEQEGALVAVTQDLPFRDLVASTGVWITLDDGANWFQANEGLPMLRVSAVEFDPHDPDHIVIGTYGRGFYRASFASIVDAAAP